MGNYANIPTSIGNVIPRTEQGNGSGAFIETSLVPFTGNVYQGTAHELGTFSLDGHTYTIYHGRYNQSPTMWIFTDGVQTYETYLPGYSTWSGFWCDIVNNLATIYWVTAPDPVAVSGYSFPLPTGDVPGNPYIARTILSGVEEEDIPEHEWDVSPSTDYTDPDNMDPRGGENADTEPFGTTDLMTLDSLPNPEIEQNMDYSGIIKTYVMSATQMNSIALMFTGTVWDDLKAKFGGVSDPMSYILSAIQVPFAPTGVTQNVPFRLGGFEVTGSSVDYTKNRYLSLNMGSVKLNEVWGSARDYSDVSIDLFLPYCGTKQVDPDICINATNTLMCYVDMWTGDVTYLLHVSNTNSSGKYYRSESVPYRWTGNCAKKVPLGRIDNSNQVLAAAGAIAGLGVGVAGGLAAPGTAAVTAEGMPITDKSFPILPTAAGLGALTQVFKPTVQTSGGVAGSTGAMDYQKAYFIVKRAVPQYPNNWRSQIGAPRYQTFTIGDLSGFTLFSDLLLDDMGIAVKEEIEELKALLTTEGVIL